MIPHYTSKEIPMNTHIPTEHSRTAALIGTEGFFRLQHASVAVFGIGGVGGHLAEALARAGVGRIHLIDRDVVSLSNINRQAVICNNFYAIRIFTDFFCHLHHHRGKNFNRTIKKF